MRTTRALTTAMAVVAIAALWLGLSWHPVAAPAGASQSASAPDPGGPTQVHFVSGPASAADPRLARIHALLDLVVPAEPRSLLPDWTVAFAATTACDRAGLAVTGCTEGDVSTFTPQLWQAPPALRPQLVAHEFAAAVTEHYVDPQASWSGPATPAAARAFSVQAASMDSLSDADAFASCLTRAWSGAEAPDAAAPVPCPAPLAQLALADLSVAVRDGNPGSG